MATSTKSNKLCPSCGHVKSVDEFAPDRHNSGGRAGHCRECKAAKYRAYYAKNRDYVIERVRYYAEQNAERVAKADADKRKKKPDIYKAHSRKSQSTRRARMRDAFVEYVDHRLVYERDEGVCGICGTPAEWEDYEMDHVIPISKGGKHEYSNVQVSHKACNRMKHARQFDI